MKLKQSIFFIVFSTFLIAGILFALGITKSQSINIRGVEPNVVYSIEQLMDKGILYSDVKSVPYSVTQYSPLYYVLVANISKAIGIVPSL